MKDNTRTAIGYICIAAVFVTYFSMFPIMMFPTEHTVNINMTSDDNTLEIIKTMERMQNQSNQGVICNQTINVASEETNTSS